MRRLLRQDLGELCALPNLHDLNVSFNSLRSLAGLGRGTTPALTHLNAAHNALTSAALKHVAALSPHLRVGPAR